MFYDNPNLINTRTEQIQKVTAADVQRVAKKYLTKENRSVIITMPKAGARRREASNEAHPIARCRVVARCLRRSAAVRRRSSGPPGRSRRADQGRRDGAQEQGAGQQGGPARSSCRSRQEADLSNGVHLIVLEDHRAPQVTSSR